jgi:fucose permease
VGAAAREAVVKSSSIALHAGFVVTGMATTMLGPIVPTLEARYHLYDAQVGALFAAQFTGSVIAGTLSIAIASRLGVRIALTSGFLLLAGGIAVVAGTTMPLMALGAAMYGFGLGLLVPTTNLLIVTAAPHRAAAASSLLNVAWGVGALSWPGVVAIAAAIGQPMAAVWALAVGCAAMAAVFSGVRFAVHWAPRSNSTAAPSSNRDALIVCGALLFAYGTVEPALGGWIGPFTRRLDPSSALWLFAVAAFWAGLTGGRLMIPLATRMMSESALFAAGGSIALVAILAIQIGATPIVSAIGGAVAGVGLSPLFPITIARLSRAVRDRSAAVAGPLFALNGIGSTVGPWLVGVLSTKTGSWRIGLGVPLVGATLLLALHLFQRSGDGVQIRMPAP